MDLSHLSTADLQALHAGDLSKMSTEGLQSISGPAATPDAPSAIPASPTPQPAGGTGLMNGMEKMSENAAQGGTFGFADEIGAGIAKPVTYAMKNVLPAGMGGEDVSYDQVSKAVDKLRQGDQSALQSWNSENPELAIPSQIAGGMATMGPIGELFAAAAPETATAVQAFSKSRPYTAAAGTGAAQGALYGVGVSDEGHRGQGAIAGGVGGALLGPSIKYLGDNLVGPALSKGKSALQNFLKSSEDDVVTGAEEAATAAKSQPAQPAAPEPEISTMTNQPLGAQPGPQAGGPASLNGKLPLSPGVRARDPNLLRIEEAARQGNLGQPAQTQMQASDAGVTNAARAAMQQLKGVTNKDSDALLGDSVAQFQKQANVVKAGAQALYKERDSLMADAVLNKSKVGPSLGKDLNNVVNDPTSVAGFKSKSGAPAKALYDDFLSLIKGTQGKELPFSDLAAWRADVSNLATTDHSTAGTMAKRLGSAYDNWMDNITQDHFIKGDPRVAEVARSAGSAWKNYKTLFGSENSPVISGMVKPYDATPADFVDKVFGANIAGNGNTALNMRKMIGALPPEAQADFKNNVFSGLVSKVFEGANGDKLALGKLRDNLQKLQTSQIFKEHFSTDNEKNTVITNLVKDLSQHIQETGRRDVISPSGGAIMRGINGLLSIPAQIPLVNKLPLVKVPAELGAKAAELDQNFMDKKAFNTAMKGAAQAAHKAARGGAVFDMNALKAGISGGTAAGSVVQINSREKKK